MLSEIFLNSRIDWGHAERYTGAWVQISSISAVSYLVFGTFPIISRYSFALGGTYWLLLSW